MQPNWYVTNNSIYNRMIFKHLHGPIVLTIAMLLAGCHADVDMQNIDPRAELDLGMALPVGSVRATIGDFLGDSVGSLYVDSLQNKGVLTWQSTFQISRKFHEDSLDLTNMISSKKLTLDVYDHLPAATMIGDNKRITGTGNPITLRFELPLNLKGVNKELGGERLDSALIDMASFQSVINKKNGLPLKWEWVDGVTLELGAQIKRPKGNTMQVYTKGDADDYGTPIETVVDNFVISLMKKQLNPKTDQSLYDYNVIDSCTFYINFTFTVPEGTTVDVPKDAGFEYQLNVQFITYKAIWGKFIRSNSMYDEAEVDLSDSWGDLAFLSRSNIPFADPKVDMSVMTYIAGAMKMDGEYLYSEDANGVKHYAEFLRGNQTYRNYPKQFEEGEYLDPITSAIGDSTTNMIVHFSKDPKEGTIDSLFRNMPQKLGYKFNIDFNYQMTPQVRIVPNTSVRVDALCTLPLIFNNGLFISYSDTIKDVHLSQYTIDSLVSGIAKVDTVMSSNLRIVLKALNTIPLDVKATMRCYDSIGNMIMDPDSTDKPLLLFEQDTVTLVAPTYAFENGSWTQVEPGITTLIAVLSKEKMAKLPEINYIVYTAIIDDESLQYAYKKGQFHVRITEDGSVTLKIGLAAQVDAIINL